MPFGTSHIARVQAEPCRVCGHFDNSRFLLNSNGKSSEDGGEDGQYVSFPWKTLEYVDQRGKDGCARCSVLSEISYDVSLTLRVSWLIDPLKQGKATAATWLLQFVAESYQYWHQDDDG